MSTTSSGHAEIGDQQERDPLRFPERPMPDGRDNPVLPRPISVVGISACVRQINNLPFHTVNQRYLTALVESAGVMPIVIPAVGCAIDFPDLASRLDGLLVTGSPSNVEPHLYGCERAAPDILHDPARDATTLPLLREALHQGLPVFAICRGIQELNVALGGTLHQLLHEVEGKRDHRSDKNKPIPERILPAHPVSLTPGGYLADLAGTTEIVVNSLHGQGIDRLAEGLAVEAVSEDGVIEAVRVHGVENVRHRRPMASRIALPRRPAFHAAVPRVRRGRARADGTPPPFGRRLSMPHSAALRPPSIPHEAAEAFALTSGDGVRLRVYELRSQHRPRPVLLWGHATGFAAGSYLPLLQMLGADFRVFAFDARAHGGSDVPQAPLEQSLHMDRFARDLGQIARLVRSHVGDAPMFYASHSLSGVAALRLSGVFGETPWQAITVFEPPIVPTTEFPEHGVSYATSLSLASQARRRRQRQASPAAFFNSLAPRLPYSRFRRDMLAAHTRATLLPTADGDYQLCCPAEAEARIYLAALNASTFRALRHVPCPVHFVAGDPAPPDGPPSWAALVQDAASRQALQGRLTVLTDVGHMMPFEQPETCRAIVRQMLDRCSEDRRGAGPAA